MRGMAMGISSVAAILSVALLLFSFGCTAQEQKSSEAAEPAYSQYTPAPAVAPADATLAKVDVFHFHGNQQCYSCVQLGDMAERAIANNFKSELESGRLQYRHVNAQAPENAALAQEYQVTSISLQIGTQYDGNTKRENLVSVWSYLGNEGLFEQYLSGILRKRLAGELD